MKYLTFALPKGRLADLTIDLLESVGLSCPEIKNDTRKLIFFNEELKLKFILVKPSDVPTYVEYGAADIGVAGRDTLLEEGRNLYEVGDLGFGKCKMVVAGPKEYLGKLDSLSNKRVATKYPKISSEFFNLVKKESIEIIKLNGSVELAPIVGLSEVIVDIVESGSTLKENGLVVLEEICDLSARLIVNRVSMKMKAERISEIINKIKAYMDKVERKTDDN
ncbi:MAG: ATP phosphoribosyltransferase [Deltaproteobacteria bacterium]